MTQTKPYKDERSFAKFFHIVSTHSFLGEKIDLGLHDLFENIIFSAQVKLNLIIGLTGKIFVNES